MSTELIVIKQLPVIEEQLLQIKVRIEERVASALALVCTEDTVKTIKKVRTELNRDFNALEEKRKEVKSAILTPYNQFEATYRECVSDIFKPADEQLKTKIAEIEGGLKEQRRSEAEAFFNKYAASKGIDFVDFNMAGINVTLSASMKSLKDQGQAFIDNVAEELAYIETQEHKSEILVEYKTLRNLARAMIAVNPRHAAIEAENKRREAAHAVSPPTPEPEPAPSLTTPPAPSFSPGSPEAAPGPDAETPAGKIFTAQFSVRCSLEQLRALKQFLDGGQYSYTEYR